MILESQIVCLSSCSLNMEERAASPLAVWGGKDNFHISVFKIRIAIINLISELVIQ